MRIAGSAGGSKSAALPAGMYSLRSQFSCTSWVKLLLCALVLGAGAPQACPRGSYSPNGETTGATSCKACPAGNYSDTPGATSCKPCPAGWTTRGQGSTSLSTCDFPAHAYLVCSGGSFSGSSPPPAMCDYDGCSNVPCIPGSFGCNATTSTSYWDCFMPVQPYIRACFYSTADKENGHSGIIVCPEPPCPAGFYSPNGRGGGTGHTCSMCDVGKYSDTPGATSCKPCPTGWTTWQIPNGRGATSCDVTTPHPCNFAEDCDYADCNAPLVCSSSLVRWTGDPGTLCSSNNGWSETGELLLHPACDRSDGCKVSGKPYWSPEKIVHLGICPPPQDCPPGSYSPNGKNIKGDKACRTCDAGSFSSMSGATSCESCPAGWTNAGQGSTTCDVRVVPYPCITKKDCCYDGCSNLPCHSSSGYQMYCINSSLHFDCGKGADEQSSILGCYHTDIFTGGVSTAWCPSPKESIIIAISTTWPSSTTPTVATSPSPNPAKPNTISTTPSPGTENALIIPSSTPFFVMLMVTMPYTRSEFHPENQYRFKVAIGQTAGTTADNVDIVSITDVRRRAGKVDVETKVRSLDGNGNSAILRMLGNGEDLKARLNAALLSQGLKEAIGVSSPSPSPKSAAPLSTPAQEGKTSSGVPLAVIIGGTAGGGFVLLVCALVFLCYRSNCKYVAFESSTQHRTTFDHGTSLTSEQGREETSAQGEMTSGIVISPEEVESNFETPATSEQRLNGTSVPDLMTTGIVNSISPIEPEAGNVSYPERPISATLGYTSTNADASRASSSDTSSQSPSLSPNPAGVSAGQVAIDPNEADKTNHVPEHLEQKFCAMKIKLGSSAISDLREFLGLDDDIEYVKLRKYPLVSMQAEWDQHGDANDRANFQYILHGAACVWLDIPAHVKETIAKGKYHGGPLAPDDYDKGHEGMHLEDFVKHPVSKTANLKEFHVAALRMYTSCSYRKFNGPLRSQTTPHPFKMNVLILDEALRKLRKVEATRDQVSYASTKILYRGMSDVELDLEDFKRVGGNELALMSTTADPQIALNYASRGQVGLMFRYSTIGQTRGVSIDFLSLYPKEVEFLFPPLTNLTYDVNVLEGEEASTSGVTVIPVRPTWS